jgi:IS5 family transposase
LVGTTVAAAAGQAVDAVQRASTQVAAALAAAGDVAVTAAGTVAGAVVGTAEQVTAGLGQAAAQAAETASRLAQQAAESVQAGVKKGKAAAKKTAAKVSATRQRVEELTRQMAELATKTVKHGEAVLQRLRALRERASEKLAKKLQALESKLDDALEVTRRVLGQTSQRLAGVASIPNRIVSIFDRDARPIRRGKMSQPVEFGYKAVITEVEGGVVSDYQVFEGNPSDSGMAVPAVEHHKKQFGHAPHAFTADMGYSSAENEQAVKKAGVKHVAMPTRGKPDEKRKRLQGNSWFRRLQKWRTGCEATISRLKRHNQMDCSLMPGLEGTSVWVGFSVFTQNLGRIRPLQQARVARAAARAARKVAQSGTEVEVMARG